ncbi:ABC transporter permease [Pseudooceanicola nitratireducens]|jgi:spermidine/putrescine transport system permease protein|uniref:ABC transporter permease n=1 Tax=Pseudooceanicola nitratireducens TaxID=517719 RepID=UPI00310A8CB7
MSDKLNVRHFPGFGFYTLVFFVWLYFPIFVIVLYSFNANTFASVWSGFSTEWYGVALQNRELMQAFKTSLSVAAFATVIATVTATLAAMVLVRGRGVKYRGLSETIVSLPLVLPEIVLAVAMLVLFAELGVRDGYLKVVIAHSTFCIPFAFLPIRARLQGMDPAFEEASRDLFASSWTTFRKVTFPMILPGIFSGATLAFVISMDDFITSNMLATGGTTTLPVYIYSLIRVGLTPELNAISALIVLFTLSVAILVMTVRAIMIARRSKRLT